MKWVHQLKYHSAERNDCFEVLSESEKIQVKRFKFQHLQDHYIFSHGKLRECLCDHLDIPPEAIQFEHTQMGKPFIAPSQNPNNIEFNLSHSDDLVLIGISDHKPIGVDIESHHSRGSMDIAKRFFAQEEIEYLEKQQKDTFQEAFLWVWTRKEAMVKCTGQGIASGLDSFSVIHDTRIDTKICDSFIYSVVTA